MSEGMMTIVHAAVQTLSPIHYFAFFITFFAWVFLLILTYAVRKSRLLFGLLSLFAVFTFFVGPFISYFFVESYAKKSELQGMQTQQLLFVNRVVTKGTLANLSNRTLKSCRILSYAVPKKGNVAQRFKRINQEHLYTVTEIERDLSPGGKEPFYITVGGIEAIEHFDLYHFTFCK